MQDLSGKQWRQLQQALVSAFPTYDELQQMIRYELGLNIMVIARGAKEPLPDIVDKIIQWADAHATVNELIIAARRGNPYNVQLSTLAAELLPPPNGNINRQASDNSLNKLHNALLSAFPTLG